MTGPTEPHDGADANPGTIHLVAASEGRPAGSMRLIPNMEQGLRLWAGWPAGLEGNAWEVSRVSLLPSHRGDRQLLGQLLRAAGAESLRHGCVTWIAAVSENMLGALSRLGISIDLLNDARPIDYSTASGIHPPVDGRKMIPAVVRVEELYQSWR